MRYELRFLSQRERDAKIEKYTKPDNKTDNHTKKLKTDGQNRQKTTSKKQRSCIPCMLLCSARLIGKCTF